MATDLTKIIITAKDEASAVFAKVQGGAEKLHGAYAKLAGLMATAIGVGSFAAMIKGAIDAGDELNKLSQKTGIAVSELSSLKYAADLSGVSGEALGKGLKTLSERMVQATDATSKQAQLFRVLGVDVTQGPMKALEGLAGAFAGLKDGETKAALATELFGKAGVDMIPLLNQGTDGLKKMREEAERLGLVMSDDAAKAAEQFNDNMRAVRGAAEGAARTIFNDLSDSFVRVASAMKEAAIEGGTLQAVWVGLGGVLAEILGLNDTGAKRIREINAELARLNDEIRSGANAGLIVQQELIEQRKPRIKQLEDELRVLKEQQQVEALARQFRNVTGGASSTAGVGDKIRGILSGQTAKGPGWAEREIAAASKTLAVARAELDNGTDRLTGSERKLLEVMQSPEWAKSSKAERDRIASLYAQAAALEKAAKSAAFYLEENKKNADAAKQHGDALEEMVNSLDEEAERYETDVKILGLSSAAREKEILLIRKRGDLLAAQDNPQAIRDIEEAYNRMFAAIDNREVMDRQISFWTQVGDLAGNFFADLVMNGKSAFDKLRQYVKQLLAEMVALFAKRWILQLAAAGTTGAASTALANQAANVGTNSLAGTAISWGADALGYTSTGVGVAGFAGDFAAGWSLGGTTGVAAAQGTTGFAAGEWMASLGATGWGLIIVAAIAVVAAIIGNKGGGPKTGGSFFSGGDVPGTDNGRFYTPNQGDSIVRDIVNATITSYTDIATRLGGTAGKFNFGLGFDNDPNGSARSRVSSLVTDANGRPIYGVTGVEMDDKEVQGRLALETQRMIVAALQASDLPSAIRDVFANIDVASATAEQLTDALNRAIEIKNIIDVLALWDVKGLTVESIKAMNREGETLTQTLTALAAAQQTYYQNFFTEEERHQMGIDQLTKLFKAQGLEMPKTREEFRKLVEGLDLTTEAGAKLYRWLMEVSGAFADVVPPLEDVNEVVEDVTTTATAAVQMIDQALSRNKPAGSLLDAWVQMSGARNGIRGFLDSLITGETSTLSPTDRIDQARANYLKLLDAANGGDVNAAGQLQGAADTYLKLAREMFGSSSAYVTIFNQVFDQLAKFAEVKGINERMLDAQVQALSYQAQTADTLLEVRDILVAIRDRPSLASADSWVER